jgi:hypothetical protein
VTSLSSSIYFCIAALLLLLWVLRRDRVSLGLPFAYLSALLLIHVPGALANARGAGFLTDTDLVTIGIQLTAIGAACFVVGVWLARSTTRRLPVGLPAVRHDFWLFCLLGGWFVTYALSPLGRIPSLGAAIEKGGAIWMLGVMLGLRAALPRRELKWAGIWIGALLVFPVMMLLLEGFMSYGSTAVIIACSILAVSTRKYWRVLVGITVAAFFGLTLFANYYQTRDRLRSVIASNASMNARTAVITGMFANFKLLDPTDPTDLSALDERLNQNYFVGLAATRIEAGEVDYLYGRSVRDAVFAVVPRFLWPDKPVFGGSPAIVSEMTGLHLSPTTSFGVGNVMEFQINFGTPGVVFGFLLLGWLIGTLDLKAAIAESRGDAGKTILGFLPAVALIQPNGSMVELAGGAAAALVAAYGWDWAWRQRERRIAVSPHARSLVPSKGS